LIHQVMLISLLKLIDH